MFRECGHWILHEQVECRSNSESSLTTSPANITSHCVWNHYHEAGLSLPVYPETSCWNDASCTEGGWL